MRIFNHRKPSEVRKSPSRYEVSPESFYCIPYHVTVHSTFILWRWSFYGAVWRNGSRESRSWVRNEKGLMNNWFIQMAERSFCWEPRLASGISEPTDSQVRPARITRWPCWTDGFFPSSPVWNYSFPAFPFNSTSSVLGSARVYGYSNDTAQVYLLTYCFCIYDVLLLLLIRNFFTLQKQNKKHYPSQQTTNTRCSKVSDLARLLDYFPV